MDINEAFEKELKKSEIMKGNASQGKKEAIREIAKRFHTAGYKEGRVDALKRVKAIRQHAIDVGGKADIIVFIETELEKENKSDG